MSIENMEYHNGKIIAIVDDNIQAINSKGELCEIPPPKFRHKQIVKTTDTYFSPKSFTRLLRPTYTENRGWVYGEGYINRDGTGGGSGWSFNEDSFLPLTDARDILIAKRIEIKERLAEISYQSKVLTEELSKVEYAINITQPQP